MLDLYNRLSISAFANLLTDNKESWVVRRGKGNQGSEPPLRG